MKRLKTNTYFIGIDQTGAVNSRKQPRPLPACLIYNDQVYFFYLGSLNLAEILKIVKAPSVKNLLICVDCVLGLPQDLKTTWQEALDLLPNFPGYGREPASQFFRHLGQGESPRRQVEIKFKANSVFQEKPFQKNIQTGTFRIWKDILADRKNFYVPALEQKEHSKQAPLFEGYPSLSWRLLLNNPKRDPHALGDIIKERRFPLNWTKTHQQQVEKDSNLADAFVLALTMKLCFDQLAHIKPHPEGAILMDENLL